MAEAAAAATGATPTGEANGEGRSASQQALNVLAGDTSTGTGETTDNTPEAATTGPEPEAKPHPEAEASTDADDSGPEPEPDDLGDAGKRAIDRMKTERSTAIRAQKKAEATLAERDAELAEAKNIIRQLKIEKLANGKLRNTSDALVFLTDLNGDEDDKTITKAIDKLISERPYLAPDREADKDDDPDGLAALFPDGTLKPTDQHTANAAQFGAVLDQLGLSI